jgi:hypothetical protein
MTNRAILVLFCFTILIQRAFAQIPSIEWQNTIGGSDIDQLFSLKKTTDGGYILGGKSKSGISGDKSENSQGNEDFWIVKVDSLGTIQWQNTIGGSGSDIQNVVLQTADGGYLLGGISNSNISGDKTENCLGGMDIWIVKTDATGNIVWQNTIGGSAFEDLYENTIIQTTDGGYLVGATSGSGISGDKTENTNGANDYWIIKLNASGNIQWQNSIGGINSDDLLAICQTTDGGFMLGGESKSNISGDKTENNIDVAMLTHDYWIVKTDSAGIIQWQNTIGGSEYDVLRDLQQTADGGYILGGTSLSNISGDKTENCFGDEDYWIVKTDAAGDILWQNTIGGTNYDYCRCILQTADGGFLVGGDSFSYVSGEKTESTNGSNDFWIVKLNSTGSILWQNSIGGSNADVLCDAHQTSDLGYILGGLSISNISGDKTEMTNGNFDYWILKLAPDTLTGIEDIQLTHDDIKIFPNPGHGQIQITCSKKIDQVTVRNIFGQMVLSKIPDMDYIFFDVAAPGIYVVQINSGNGSIAEKLIVY